MKALNGKIVQVKTLSDLKDSDRCTQWSQPSGHLHVRQALSAPPGRGAHSRRDHNVDNWQRNGAVRIETDGSITRYWGAEFAHLQSVTWDIQFNCWLQVQDVRLTLFTLPYMLRSCDRWSISWLPPWHVDFQNAQLCVYHSSKHPIKQEIVLFCFHYDLFCISVVLQHSMLHRICEGEWT